MIESPINILDLSLDIIELISDHINYEDILEFCLTCKAFYSVFNCETGQVRKVKLKNAFHDKKCHEIVNMIEGLKQDFASLYDTFKKEHDASDDYSFSLNSKLCKFMANPENSVYLDTFVVHVTRNPGMSPNEACKTIIDHAYLFIGYQFAGVTVSSSHQAKLELYYSISGYQDYDTEFITELGNLFYSTKIDMTNFHNLNRRMIVEELCWLHKDILPFHKFLTNLS